MTIRTDPTQVERAATPARSPLARESKDRTVEPAPTEPVPAPPAAADETARPSARAHPARALTIGAGALAIVAAAYLGWQYWTVGRFQVSTDDAYVQADNTTIAPKVSGYISEVAVADNEAVRAGR